ncbi:DUF3137 domain-containing protein [Helicobacter burdigaliensis]|uniref:DUF3137 domain-containing protein n=1 Tax=Helicobacter burdigaliensis TaxID=2315334 RepID=UPI000EF65100|nr:DUF3137 domain-containing protein [Helicobacter burdigaliensis]
MPKPMNLNVDFDREIAPLLWEAKRDTLKFKAKDIKIFFIFIVCSILGTLLAYWRLSTQGDMKNLLAVGVVIVIFGIGLLSLRQKRSENILKAHIFNKLLDKFNLEYFNDSSESIIFAIDNGLFPPYDYSRIDDGFKGYEKGFFVSILELSLHNVGQQDIPQKAKFKGLLLEYTFEDCLKDDLYLLLKPKKFFDFSKNPDLIKLESTLELLGKEYEIFTNDEEKAKGFLTPKFLDKLARVQGYFGISSVFCSVFNNTCMLALPTNRDFFRLKSSKLEELRVEFNVLLKELQNISDFGKELKEVFKS